MTNPDPAVRVQAIRDQIKSNKLHERHRTNQETHAWCRQWRLVAEQAEAELQRLAQTCAQQLSLLHETRDIFEAIEDLHGEDCDRRADEATAKIAGLLRRIQEATR